MIIRQREEQLYITGEVVHGKKLGRTIGFPTANIEAAHTCVAGVYSAYVFIDGTRYKAVMNIGTRPTIADGTHETIEVHILDFDGDVYGQTLTVEVVQFLRHEQKFDGLDALLHQLQRDAFLARKFL